VTADRFCSRGSGSRRPQRACDVPEGEADPVRGRRLGVRRLVLVAPRGYCAGVERAVQVVEVALERWGPPIYVCASRSFTTSTW
jgi:hypothetical protein